MVRKATCATLFVVVIFTSKMRIVFGKQNELLQIIGTSEDFCGKLRTTFNTGKV